MIPIVDLAAQYRLLKPDIDAAIEAVLRDGKYVLGPAVDSFERDFAEYCGTSHAVGTNSGTSALHLALLAASASGDEVITVPFTFIATVAAIEYTGARPMLVDVEPDYYTMDPSALERAITPRTRAVVPVHLFGQPAAMADIVGIARRHRLVVIEDACQAHGAEHDGRRVGSLGDIGCFSFYHQEPGSIRRRRRRRDEQQRLRRFHEAAPFLGRAAALRTFDEGFNYRMDGIQGAILRVKLKHLDDWIDARETMRACTDSYSPTRLSAHRGSGPGCATCISNTRCACRSVTPGARISAKSGYRPRSITRFLCTCSLHTATSDTARVIFRSVRPWRRRFCRFRSSRR